MYIHSIESTDLGAGSQVIGTVVDVSKRDQVDAWISSIGKEHGKIHGGANVAGIGGGWRATTIGDIVRSLPYYSKYRSKKTGIP